MSTHICGIAQPDCTPEHPCEFCRDMMIHDTKTCNCEQCQWADKQMSKERTFADVLNEWTSVTLEENRTADLLAIAPILRLGLLGQRLIQEANSIGMRDVAKMVKQ